MDSADPKGTQSTESSFFPFTTLFDRLTFSFSPLEAQELPFSFVTRAFCFLPLDAQEPPFFLVTRAFCLVLCSEEPEKCAFGSRGAEEEEIATWIDEFSVWTEVMAHSCQLSWLRSETTISTGSDTDGEISSLRVEQRGLTKEIPLAASATTFCLNWKTKIHKIRVKRK